jgi:hypothetical protein
MPLQMSPKSTPDSHLSIPRRSSFVPSLFLGAALMMPFVLPHAAVSQAPAAAATPNPNAPQRGTVKAINGSTLTVAADTGKTITVTLSDAVKVTQLAPGSTDLKTGTAAQVSDISTGDRILVSVKAGDAPDTYTSARVILMKSADIADRQAAQKADWQRRGSGGLVSAVDPATGTITVSSGAKKIQVTTSMTTIFRRYAPDSIKFEDAQVGTLAQIQPGDQLRMRGAKSEDGTSEVAEEIVSGSFRNLSGTVVSIDAANNAVTVKDLATKKNVLVKVTTNSEIKTLPAMMATRLAAMSKGGAAGAPGAGGPGGGGVSGGGRPAGAPGAGGPPAGGTPEGGMGRPGGGGMGAGGGRAGGGDLSSMVARLPEVTLSTLKAGDALMIVGTQTQAGTTGITAITVLSGVEPLLTAPGGNTMTLSPWSMGGAPGGEGGGGGQ